MALGIIGKKLGMTQYFAEGGSVVPVTVIQAGPCTVVQVKTQSRDGYQAVQLGFGPRKRASKPEQGHLKGLGPFQVLREFWVDDAEAFQSGQQVGADIFSAGDLVDVVGRSRGMGFAGVVKRHHFRGGPKTHGQSNQHRAPGAIGAGTSPGHVRKGLRMAGHMGDERVTTQNLEIVKVDPAKSLLLIKGAVPGSAQGIVLVRRAIKSRGQGQAGAGRAE